MSDKDLQQELVDLFRSAKKAHERAYLETDGFDPDWPLWYADYLLEPLKELFNAPFTKSELVYLLVSVDKAQRLRSPGADWATDYARFFLERFA